MDTLYIQRQGKQSTILILSRVIMSLVMMMRRMIMLYNVATQTYVHFTNTISFLPFTILFFFLFSSDSRENKYFACIKRAFLTW